MLKAIKFIHSKGIAHRDLKLENILVDENFNIKINDFGLSASTEGQLMSHKGTLDFWAPEIFEATPN